jgi:acyl carrier protein
MEERRSIDSSGLGFDYEKSRFLAMVRETLGSEAIDIADDFFMVGGDSLKAVAMLSRLRGEFNVEMDLEKIFSSQSILEIYDALAIKRGASPSPGSDLPFEATPTNAMIANAPRAVTLPVSWEETLLFDTSTKERPVYPSLIMLRLRGSLDVEALLQSVDRLVERQAILRTRFFVDEAGCPARMIHPPKSRVTRVERVRASCEADVSSAAVRYSLEDARMFDLGADSLFRSTLVIINGEEYVLLLTLHHIIYDGWSGAILIRELSSLYRNATVPEPPIELPGYVQYSDYAYWQRSNELSAGERGRLLAYWRECLESAPPLLQLPTDWPRSSGSQKYVRQTEPVAFSRELVANLRSLGQRCGATLYMVLLTALDILLARICGQNDIVVACPVSTRTRTELEGTIGDFINLIVLRNRVDGSRSFLSQLEQVRETTLRAYSHRSLPFADLADALQAKGASRFLQVYLDMPPEVDLGKAFVECDGLEVTENSSEIIDLLAARQVESLGVALDMPSPAMDLIWFVAETATGMSGYLAYNARLFDRATARQLVFEYYGLLHDMVRNPEAACLADRSSGSDGAAQYYMQQ